MAYVIKAILANPNIPENGVLTVSFPLSRKEYDHAISGVMEPIGIGDAVTQDCFVQDIDSSYDILQRIKNQIVNVDELDYLAKRLDSFDEYEAEQFQASCSALGCRDIKDLINLTFCCQKTTVISDFNSLDEAGKQHYMTVHEGAVSTDELAAVDGKALIKRLIQSGEGKVTPYGLFFRNEMRMKNLYQGQGFPPYLWDERQAELKFTKQDGTEALLFLPAAELEIEHFLLREDIPDVRECNHAIHVFYGQGDHYELKGGIAELKEWNELCNTLNAMPLHHQEIFAAAMEVTGAKDLAQMKLLVSNIYDFDLIPGVTDAESYGKYMIQASGKYYYDDSLDSYYNYEAFGELLMIHEAGRFTRQGYLKCGEDSAFLDFFVQESSESSQNQIPTDARGAMQMGGMQ